MLSALGNLPTTLFLLGAKTVFAVIFSLSRVLPRVRPPLRLTTFENQAAPTDVARRIIGADQRPEVTEP